jgi:hypothetical protein
VVKGAAAPTGGVVALLAGLGEIGSDVARVGRALKVRQVTRNASATGQVIRARRAVCGVVALRALQGGMRAGQGEAGAGVVEGCSQPVSRAVALVAGLREIRSQVTWVGRISIIRHVASDAGTTGQAVSARRTISGVVTLGALKGGMRAGQGKACCGVIERCSTPVSRVVALLAGLGEIRLHVVGTIRSLKVAQVATHASSVGQVVRPRRAKCGVVALRALQAGMSTGQGEAGRCVIELGRAPGRSVVTLIASL